MEQNRIIYLHQQYLNQNLTSSELQEWKSILADPQNEHSLKELMKETWDGLKATVLKDMAQAQAENLLQEIVSQPQFRETRKLWWPKWAVAASITLAVMIGGYFYYDAHHQPKIELAYQNDIAPGKDGATLTLANGRKILISDALTGKIATEAGVTITKTDDGQLLYTVSPSGGDAEGRGGFNTLTTTRGEQTKVRLPDGTLVFLNSASTLKYSTIFDNERRVALTGEAYFQVAHNKEKPFKVISNGQEVKVLGTHFNINSYTDETAIRTTLLEGSVHVSSLRGTKQSQILIPRQQAALSPSGSLTVEQVNADDVIAWTSGKFIFENQSIEAIMRTLSRWYDVEVVYQGNVKNNQFAGTLSRKDNISKILDKIAFTQAAHFKIEGRRITVMP